MRIPLQALLCVFVVLISGCKPILSFGDDVELSGAAFDTSKLSEVSTLTGINFPAGTEGIEYYYLGSGIDDALAAKIRIPNDRVVEFKSNTIFSEGSDSKPGMEIGRSKSWWKVDGLSGRIDRTKELPDARYLEFSFGKEGEEYIVYLIWISM